MENKPRGPVPPKKANDLPARVYRGVLIVLQVVMLVELIWVLYEQQWINAFLVVAITVSKIGRASCRERV